jgi:hypothetical protein
MALPAITLRNTKGSALTHTEMDTNLTNLQQANIQVTAAGTTTNIALGGGFTLSAGANIGLTNSAGNITITNTQTAGGGGGGLANVVEDTTPQLGGNLDIDTYFITSSAGPINIDKNTTIYGAGAAGVGIDIFNSGSGAFNYAHVQLVSAVEPGETTSVEFGKAGNAWTGSGVVTSWKPGDAGFLNFGYDMRIGCSGLLGSPQGNVIFGTHADGADTVTFDLSTGTSDVILHSGNLRLAENKGIYSDAGLIIGCDDVILGSGNATVAPEVAITTAGGQGLIFDTNQGVNTGSFTVFAGVNGNIELTPNGTGRTVITNATLINADIGNITSVNKVTITAPATSATLTIANGKTLTASNTITLAGTDSKPNCIYWHKRI